MGRKLSNAVLLLHKKSCTRPEVKQAVRAVQDRGVDLDVFIPWRH